MLWVEHWLFLSFRIAHFSIHFVVVVVVCLNMAVTVTMIIVRWHKVPLNWRRMMNVMRYLWVNFGRSCLTARITRQYFRHKTNVSDGQAKCFDARQSFFVGKCWNLACAKTTDKNKQNWTKTKKSKLALIKQHSTPFFRDEKPTFLRSLSNASFKLNMRRRSRMLAARLWAIDATRRRVFFDEPLDAAPRGDESRCETMPGICDRGQSATMMEEKRHWMWKISGTVTAAVMILALSISMTHT